MTSVVASFIRDLDVVLGGKAYSLHKKEIKLSFTLILHHKYTWLNVCRMHHIQGLGTHRSILTVCKFFQHASLNCRQVTNSAFSEIFSRSNFYLFFLRDLTHFLSLPYSKAFSFHFTRETSRSKEVFIFLCSNQNLPAAAAQAKNRALMICYIVFVHCLCTSSAPQCSLRP